MNNIIKYLYFRIFNKQSTLFSGKVELTRDKVSLPHCCKEFNEK